MRIVAGRHKGRRLAAPDGRDTRPTADRARQALFDVLAHSDRVELDGALVVDAFAGSGALGLEALSRGAARACFLETGAPALAALRANIAALGEEAAATVLRADATRPPPAPAACTLALLDPPYGKGLAEPTLTALAQAGWLADGALAVVELAAADPFIPPPGFETVDERRWGAARVMFAVYAK
ncbi:MAG: 16S rRNA (guanine(966)-N(2))-methyltransferase RsmD [Actinomycetota bacterium]